MIQSLRSFSFGLSGSIFWVALAALLFCADALAGDWYPLQVDVWDPPFNNERQRRTATYTPLEKATQRWNICVSIPHLKDAYWLAANFGLVAEARRLGVNLVVYEAGGYERIEVQRQQIAECLSDSFGGQGPDGFILSAVDADAINDLVTAMKADGVPVVDLINGINSPDIAGRSAVNYYDLGYRIGEYLLEQHPAAAGPAKVAWFPGPAGPVWSTDGDNGFQAALAGSHIEIVATRYGDTGTAKQTSLIEAVLDERGEAAADGGLDYIVGNAPSAEAALSVLRKRGLESDIQVLSYYYGPGVHQAIKRGVVLAAPTDSPVLLSRLAVDMMTRILEQRPFLQHVAPKVVLVDRDSLRGWDSSIALAPRGFRATFSVEQ